MQALHFDGTRVQLAERPEPVPLPGEVVVSVRRAGICNTDLEIARGYMGFTGVLGHELLGTVEGRRVAAEINFACGTCATCQKGERSHCPRRTVLGIVGRDGALAERVAVPSSALHLVPDGVADDAAVFAEPLAAALHVLDDVPARRGDRVAVLGDGKLGLLCALALATTPAEVVLVGHHETHFPTVSARGVRAVLEKDLEASAAASFDAVVEATGSPRGLARALALVRPRGTIVLKSTYATAPDVNLAPVVIHEVRVVGSRCGSIPRALRALEERVIDPTSLLAATFPLSLGLLAFTRAREPGILKVTVAPGAATR